VAAALSFGGRTVSGSGFGIPLVLRYVLELAQTTAEAVKLLQRVPASMCYSVTLLDRQNEWATVFVSPDRPAEVTRRNVVTNFQNQVDWPEHASATHAVQRRDTLQKLVDGPLPMAQVVDALLQPPLFQTADQRGPGTLYTAGDRPRSAAIELLWPQQRWAQSLHGVSAGQRDIVFVPGETPP
jgi:predicted choloylglycine hydrolase